MQHHPIRAWRQKHNITQQEFAARLDISEAQLSRIETGASDLSMELARKVVEETRGEVSGGDLIAFSPGGRPPNPDPAPAAA